MTKWRNRKRPIRNGLVFEFRGREFMNLPATSAVMDYSGNGNNGTPANFGYIAPYTQITSDFAGKISGSVVENPNIGKWTVGKDYLITPSGSWNGEFGINSYSKMSTINGDCEFNPIYTSGQIPQHLFSFNLIQIFERRHGTIPSTDQTTAGKVAWLKANLGSLGYSWYGYGVCPRGNKGNMVLWDAIASSWGNIQTTTAGTPTLVSNTSTSISARIDANGFVHFLAYTDSAAPKNLFPTANISNIETDASGFTTYGASTVSRDTVEHYEGTGCLKVITNGVAGGEGFFTAHTNTNASQQYTSSVYLKGSGNVRLQVRYRDSSGTLLGSSDVSGTIALTDSWVRSSLTFTTPANTAKIDIDVVTPTQQAITFYADALQLEAGASATPWSIASSAGDIAPSTIYTDYVKLDLTFKAASGSDNQGGVVFDGVDDYITVTLPSIGAGDYTVEFDVAPDAANPSSARILHQANGLQCGINGGIQIYTKDTSWRTSAYTMTAGKHSHIAIKREGANIYFYAEGEQVGTPINVGTAASLTGGTTRIGWNESATYLKGAVNYIKLYKKALTAQEIKKNYLVEKRRQ